MAIEVTADWVDNFIRTQPAEKVVVMVGRALLVLHSRQTAGERESKRTVERNGMGFNGFDAEMGSSMAQQFERRGTLTPAQVAVWTKAGKNGRSRLSKYARQLNEAAQARAAK